MRTHIKRAVAAAGLVALLGGLAACGDDDDSSGTATTAGGTETTAGGATTTAAGGTETTAGGTETTTGGEGGTEAQVAAAKEFVEPYLERATSINIDVPLSKKPEEGITVGWLEGNVDPIRVITPGFQEAVDALGWELATISYDVADPQSVNAAMQQAVDQGVDYIAITGLNTPSYESAIANAKAADIPVVQMDIAAEEGAEEKGVLGCIACDAMVEEWGRIMGNWIIQDSGAEANVVYVTIPEFSSLIPEGETLRETLEEGCSNCQLDLLESTIQSFSTGGIAGEVASYVQTHPDLDYIYFAFGGMGAGSREALDSAGIGQDVKIVVADPDLAGMQNLIDGKHQAGVNLSVEQHAWNAIDLMARDSVGDDIQPIIDAALPTEVYTPENVPQPAALYHGAEGYQDQFKTLWLVT